MPSTSVLHELKRLILVKSGIRIINPSDCRVISMAIQKELRKNVSETTIKRLFGFAQIKHEFSKFTINTLKEYAGMVDELPAIVTPKIWSDDLNHIRQLADKITHQTLQNIRHRCSVPYKLTIPRAFAEYDFELFHHSKFSYTAFISQPGYGKSILLSHLVQHLFYSQFAPFSKDIVLFINADQLYDEEISDLSLEDRIKHKLELPLTTDLFHFFNQQWQSYGMKFIVIIDGLSELIISRSVKPKILNGIMGFIAGIGEYESVKLVLSMRATTWNRFSEKIRTAYFFKQKWFSGSYFNANDNSNVPPLSEEEVEQIIHQMNPADLSKISESLKLQLKFPFQIQWYYQLKEEYPTFDSYTNILFYEIISRFIQEKIHNSTFSTEKILCCKRIIQLSNFGRKGYAVPKIDLIQEMPFIKEAYEELLADGILMEEKQTKNGLSAEYVRFIQTHTFEYFLFVELYELFDNTTSTRFFELINSEYAGNQVRFQLLQWAVRLMVKQFKFGEMEAVLNLNLNNYEKNYLIYFIAENLSYHASYNPTLIREMAAQELHSLLIKNLIHFDFIDSCYKDAINCLIDTVDNERNALFYHSVLSIFDCLSLDREQILRRMQLMKGLTDARKNWGIDPYLLVEIIYRKINGEGPSANPSLNMIADLHQHTISAQTRKKFPTPENVVNYLLILMVNLFYSSPETVIKMVDAIVTAYPRLKKTRGFFSIYLLNILAQAYARIHPGHKADQMEKILTDLYNDTRHDYTSYMQSVLLSIKADQSKNKHNLEAALKFAEEALSIYKRNEFAIHELYTYDFMIQVCQIMGNEIKTEGYLKQKQQLLAKKKLTLLKFSP